VNRETDGRRKKNTPRLSNSVIVFVWVTRSVRGNRDKELPIE
jgi:hypothetical protein